MPEIFLISDTHFGHANILKFVGQYGSRVRPHWEDVDSMNEDMIERWNKTVGVNDTVYHLGDVVMNRRYLPLVGRLNGNKELVMGNHDVFHVNEYMTYFKRLHGSVKKANLVMSHIPIHPIEIPVSAYGQVHGHIHEKTMNNARYFNVSVEVIDYTPISLDVVAEIMKERYKHR